MTIPESIRHTIDGERSRAEQLPAELVEWDLAQVEPWDALIGTRLASARVLSLAHFPNIIELTLGSSRLVLANSSGRELGLGDDLLLSMRPDVVPRTAKELWAA